MSMSKEWHANRLEIGTFRLWYAVRDFPSWKQSWKHLSLSRLHSTGEALQPSVLAGDLISYLKMSSLNLTACNERRAITKPLARDRISNLFLTSSRDCSSSSTLKPQASKQEIRPLILRCHPKVKFLNCVPSSWHRWSDFAKLLARDRISNLSLTTYTRPSNDTKHLDKSSKLLCWDVIPNEILKSCLDLM